MLWNCLLHAGGGVLGSNLFFWTGEGLVICLSITAIVQGIDMFRVYKVTVKRIRMEPIERQEEAMATFRSRLAVLFPQFYIAKVVGYGLLTLIVASITRSLMG